MPVDLVSATAITVAAVAAGTINTVVGSGTLITFPTLLALGYPAVTANVSNNIGLVFGGISGTWGYRRELAGQGPTLRRLAPMSLIGAITGALALLTLPALAEVRDQVRDRVIRNKAVELARTASRSCGIACERVGGHSGALANRAAIWGSSGMACIPRGPQADGLIFLWVDWKAIQGQSITRVRPFILPIY